MINAAWVGVALLLLGGPPKPRLQLTGTNFAMLSEHSGIQSKGVVTLNARIVGPITEEWYCPRVEWIWPDGTRSSEESDCPPYSPEEAKKAPYRWSRSVLIPEGEWVFNVVLWKGNKKLATASHRARVGSPQQEGW